MMQIRGLNEGDHVQLHPSRHPPVCSAPHPYSDGSTDVGVAVAYRLPLEYVVKVLRNGEWEPQTRARLMTASEAPAGWDRRAVAGERPLRPDCGMRRVFMAADGVEVNEAQLVVTIMRRKPDTWLANR
jgi:hypothetical protein